ncbi:MAG: Tic22 family protein [Cyanobacteria bacterium J06598_1]
MKSFIRRALALGAIGSSLLGATLMAPSAALALTQEQVAEKLSSVPVFVLGNESGLILISSSEEGQPAEPSLYVFMTEQDAETFLSRANEANPEFAPNAQIGLTNLEKLYQETQAEEELQLVYVPEQDEATEAAALGTGYQGGVPLFFASGEDGSPLPMQQNNGETVFPMFFSRADLESLLADLGESNPEALAAISVGVLPLEAMLIELETNDDESLNQIRLLPDSETINAIQSQSAPAAAPAAPAESE